MPVANITPATLSGPEGYRLADMQGVLSDLQWVVDACRLIHEKMAVRQAQDTVEIEALQAAALIRYGRCFSGGTRTAFILDAEWLQSLPDALQTAHGDFVTLRDKHVAHSVNDWEINVPVVHLRQVAGEPTTVSSIGVQQHRVVAVSSDSIDSLCTLACALLSNVQNALDAERQRLLVYVRTRPVAEFEEKLREPGYFAGRGKPDRARGRPD
jgi:hypothetical protein